MDSKKNETMASQTHHHPIELAAPACPVSLHHPASLPVFDDKPAGYRAEEAQINAGNGGARRVSDPFTMQYEMNNDPFNRRSSDDMGHMHKPIDRRLSKEWDAARTPPSRFQKAEGSIFSTPASRDGRIDRNKVVGYRDKVKGLGGGFVVRKKSISEGT